MASVIGDAIFTHGTLEALNWERQRRFSEEVLHLRSVRHVPIEAGVIAGRSNFGAVTIATKNAHEQGIENRWVVVVETATEVEEAHRRALSRRDDFAIRNIGELSSRAGVTSFLVHDGDGNWWEVTDRAIESFIAPFESA